MKFRKMHGCGNDFIVINGFKENINDITFEQKKFLSTQHFGIGADGILYVLPSKIADIRMQIFNLDGSEAEMCGNGIRCVSKFALEEKIIDKNSFFVETKAGIKSIDIKNNNIKVGMGMAIELENPMNKYNLFCVSMGNPHAIMIVEDLIDFPITKVGAEIENYEKFLNKTNVEFVKIINREFIELRVWERGCGETLACGTGSCATVFSLYRKKLLNNKVGVKLKGGILDIEVDKDNNIFMSGDAVNVFDGEINIDKIN